MSHQVLLVDDSNADRDLYKEYLETDGHLAVTSIDPRTFPTLADYAPFVADKFEAFVLDHRVGEESGVSFSGAELAAFIRQLDSRAPIFFLSNYAEEADANDEQGAGDAVINKNSFQSKDEARKYVMRILRGIRQYVEARSEIEKRIDDLVAKKLKGQITKEEDAELTNWRSEVAAPAAPQAMASMDQASQIKQLEQKLARLLERLEQKGK